MSKEKRTVYRLSPCPLCDVEGMESWLTDMAKRGFMLSKDGFFAGIATFECTEPQNMRYRFDTALKTTSMWAEDGDEPDPESVDLNKKYGWEYITKCRYFYIYRTSNPDTRELNTDPQVQSLAVSKAHRSQLSITLAIFLFLFVLPFIKIFPELLLTMIHMKTWVFLLGTAIFIWLFLDLLTTTLQLGRLQKKLKNGKTLKHFKDWKSRSRSYQCRKICQVGLIVAWICILLHTWSVSVTDEDTIALKDYAGIPPFVTFTDLIPGSSSYTPMLDDMGLNTVHEWSDWLAPVNYEWNEHAALKQANGTYVEGGLQINYHETLSPWVAKQLASEYYQQDRHNEHFELVECPELNVDYAVAYTGYFPTIIIQNDSKVIQASFYYHSSSDTISFEDWVTALADSIR